MEKFIKKSFVLLSLILVSCGWDTGDKTPKGIADKPLFRDPVYDGAADPVIIWNPAEQSHYMFYTNRRANADTLDGVSWVHGTKIGVAESKNGGATWEYKGIANIAYDLPDGSAPTFWAPEVIENNGFYNMYLSIVPGVFEDWYHPRFIAHFISKDLMNWNYKSKLQLSSERVIDANVFRLPDGTWRMYYNNEDDNKSIYYADSPDLYTWNDSGRKVIGDRGEGAKVFRWQGKNWLILDTWDGLGVYTSEDFETWEKQEDHILRQPGTGVDDKVKAGHADVVVLGKRAYIFYFTHPGRTPENEGTDTYETRRSSIQVAELEYENGKISSTRDREVQLDLRKTY